MRGREERGRATRRAVGGMTRVFLARLTFFGRHDVVVGGGEEGGYAENARVAGRSQGRREKRHARAHACMHACGKAEERKVGGLLMSICLGDRPTDSAPFARRRLVVVSSRLVSSSVPHSFLDAGD